MEVKPSGIEGIIDGCGRVLESSYTLPLKLFRIITSIQAERSCDSRDNNNEYGSVTLRPTDDIKEGYVLLTSKLIFGGINFKKKKT